MNLFLSTISPNNTPIGIFFSDDFSEISEVSFERNDFFSDKLSQYNEMKKVKNIFYISGPASFTSLRNMSVFLNIFSEFSDQKIQLYAIPTQDFFSISFPHTHYNILSVGRREGFIFSQKEDAYIKYKNPEIIEILQKKSEISGEVVIGGEFSEKFLSNINESSLDIVFAFPLPQKEFLQKIKENSMHYEINTASVEYGSLPHIG